MHGCHLTMDEREMMGQLLAQGESRAAIARRLGRHPSTIGRELRRNAEPSGDYRPSRAQAQADQRRRDSKTPCKLEDTDLGAYVQDHLRQYWSPEQIAGRLRLDRPDTPGGWVSHQGIYDWIARQKAAGGTWHTFLRQSRRKRRKRYGTAEKRGRIVGRVGLEKRPAVVEAKTRLGDWESDTVAGSGSTVCLATHVERVSKYTVLAKLPDGTAERFNAGTLRAFDRHSDLPCETMTADNGKEFAAFKTLERNLGLAVYFAQPYHAWERGLNENTNGLLRQFFPKGVDLAGATHPFVKHVETLLNTRPRKALGYRTPEEVLHE
jgi:transposase, IS30 family